MCSVRERKIFFRVNFMCLVLCVSSFIFYFYFLKKYKYLHLSYFIINKFNKKIYFLSLKGVIFFVQKFVRFVRIL